jgi:hypothetical protein
MAKVPVSILYSPSSDSRQTLLAGQIAIYLALGLSKMATVLIVRRLFTPTMKEPRRVCNIVLGVVILWTVASVILVSAGCCAASISPKTPFETCPGIKIRYLVVTITDALTDILLTVTPAYLCRRLNMKIWFKLQVLGIFALRLPLIMLSILFFKWWKRSFSDANPGIARMTPLIYQQCQLCMSIIVGTIPSLKGFLQSFDTGSGIKAGLRYASTSNGYPSEWSSASLRHELVSSGPLKSYRMERLDVGRRCVLRQQKNDDNGTVWVNETPYFEEVHRASMGDTGKRGRSSSRESDRRSHRSTQGLFIWKDMEWKVTRETALRESDTT